MSLLSSYQLLKQNCFQIFLSVSTVSNWAEAIQYCLGFRGITTNTYPYINLNGFLYYIHNALKLFFSFNDSQEMAKILNHPRVYAFLHIPVQSASDSVLMDMKREYCVADFKQVVDFLKEK